MFLILAKNKGAALDHMTHLKPIYQITLVFHTLVFFINILD